MTGERAKRASLDEDEKRNNENINPRKSFDSLQQIRDQRQRRHQLESVEVEGGRENRAANGEGGEVSEHKAMIACRRLQTATSNY